MDLNYILVLVNSTIRSTTPVLLATLGSAICNKVGVFNIALEGQMLIGSFFAIVVNYFTHSLFLATLAAVLSGALVGLIVAILQVKYRGADMVIGTSLNLLVAAITSILLTVILKVKGSFSSPELIPLHKVSLPIIRDIPYLSKVFGNLTLIDYLAYLIVILFYIFLYKTVAGFRTRSVGINEEAAKSLGVNALRVKMNMVIISGALCGLGGAVLSMGQVTLFTEGMTAGRGFIAMAAANMGQSHPILIIFSSLFFGVAQAFGVGLQQIIPSQLTMTIPYIFTILAIIIFGIKKKRQEAKNF